MVAFPSSSLTTDLKMGRKNCANSWTRTHLIWHRYKVFAIPRPCLVCCLTLFLRYSLALTSINSFILSLFGITYNFIIPMYITWPNTVSIVAAVKNFILVMYSSCIYQKSIMIEIQGKIMVMNQNNNISHATDSDAEGSWIISTKQQTFIGVLKFIELSCLYYTLFEGRSSNRFSREATWNTDALYQIK